MATTIREYVLSLDDYNNPKILEGEDAIVVLLIRLFLMNPGDIETHPNMGIGLYKNYRNMDMDNIIELEQEAQKQIEEYLPMLQNVGVSVSQSTTNSKVMVIEIQVGNTIYSLMNNGESLTVSLGDLK